ncbi:DNA-binding protein HGH1 [Myriangium duriaei CBS 260.36]|uniref:Protein HGH1 homolog n=1 Tax=Myriangium duriaei CBS 260.36 TaxID=1168546 RepID=A0A9P4MLC6_9PEZI|nr:DNA-binding protein HGH1 [Myriangium duriaei CBS 260.36]
MPTELEELVEFLHHGNTQVRQIAVENLVGYSSDQPELFKRNQLEPIKDLKLLIRDYTPIAKNAITMLINLSEDKEVIQALTTDEKFVETLFARLTSEKDPNANLLSMLLANMGKSDAFAQSLLTLSRSVPKPLSDSPLAIDQLLDLFVKGSAGSYNKDADYDYLCYLFADMAKHTDGRKHFLKPRREGDAEVVPFTKLVVFTEHASTIRRRGVASTIKNCAFEVSAHETLLSSDEDGVNLLPYILLPLMGPEEYSSEDMDDMLEDVQLLPPDKKREPDLEIIKTHLETLLLLTTSREGRDLLRKVKVYPIVRELHLQVEDEEVREACDRFVQVVMRKEEGETDPQMEAEVKRIQEAESSRVQELPDEEDELVEVL